MATHKFNMSIHKTVSIMVLIACALIFFSPVFSVNVSADSEPVIELNFELDVSDNTDTCNHHSSNEDNNTANKNIPCCSVPCDSCSNSSLVGMLRTSVTIDSDNLTKASLARSEQFNAEDILSSIFKPPKV